jgi:DUF1707 SHOCT-like domain
MSHAGREQVLDALKAAFVHGRLTQDEFDLRVGQVLAAYAELDAATADIPTALTTAQPPETVRRSHNKKLIQRGTAAGAGASVAFTATIAVAARGNPVISLVVVGLAGVFVAVLLAGLLRLVSWVLEMVFSRQPSPGLPPGPGGKAAQRLASGDPAGSSSQISRDPPHTARSCAAARRPRLPSLKSPHRAGPWPGWVLAQRAQSGHAPPITGWRSPQPPAGTSTTAAWFPSMAVMIGR